MGRDAVVLLHGLARQAASMARMASFLSDACYLTFTMGYDSRHFPIETLSQEVMPIALALCSEVDKVHFVTHSMGGIILRDYLSRHPINKLGQVVMLGPPNQGSQVVDKLAFLSLFKWINGPAGLQLGTSLDSRPRSLPKADFPLGIIAGERSINPLLSLLMPKPNDGKVSIENTRLAGMLDHIVLPVSHSFMMNHKRVKQQTLHFLQYQTFLKSHA